MTRHAFVVGVMLAVCASLAHRRFRARRRLSDKAPRACRKEIAGKMSKVIKTGLKVIATCHAQRDKGKFNGDCNTLAGADVKGAYAKALASTTKSIDKKCLLGNVVLGNYANGDVDGALLPVDHERHRAAGNDGARRTVDRGRQGQGQVSRRDRQGGRQSRR